MATVNAMVQNTIMKTQLPGNQRNKTSAGNSSLLGASSSRSLVGTSSLVGGSSLVNNGSSHADTNTDFAKTYLGDSGTRNNKVRDYDDDKNSFQTDFRNRMSSLKKANNSLKSLGMDPTAKQNNGTTAAKNSSLGTQTNSLAGNRKNVSQRDETDITAGYLKEEEPQEADAAKEKPREDLGADAQKDFNAIRGFVKEFNSTMTYLNEERGTSGQMSALASSFGDNEGLSDSLQRIGISVDSEGSLSVDEEKLAESLTEDRSSVDAALGSEGLAGRMERKVDMASQRADQLFPSVTDALGGKPANPEKSMYGGNSLHASNAYEDIGSLFHKVG